jgi:hypothetical protein
MNAEETFVEFVKRVLTPHRARRFAELVQTRKGQLKILHGFAHEFESMIRPTCVRSADYEKLWRKCCFVYHSPLGFGVEFPTVRDAYDQLSVVDDWLIVLQDATAGIYRPEGRFDREMLLVG